MSAPPARPASPALLPVAPAHDGRRRQWPCGQRGLTGVAGSPAGRGGNTGTGGGAAGVTGTGGTGGPTRAFPTQACIDKADGLLAMMTLDEKIAQTHQVERK